jgi:hypothetical protein
MPELWFYLDDEDEESEDTLDKEELDEMTTFERQLEMEKEKVGEEDGEVYCKQCGALVDDILCDICGWVVEV